MPIRKRLTDEALKLQYLTPSWRKAIKKSYVRDFLILAGGGDMSLPVNFAKRVKRIECGDEISYASSGLLLVVHYVLHTDYEETLLQSIALRSTFSKMNGNYEDTLDTSATAAWGALGLTLRQLGGVRKPRNKLKQKPKRKRIRKLN